MQEMYFLGRNFVRMGRTKREKQGIRAGDTRLIHSGGCRREYTI